VPSGVSDVAEGRPSTAVPVPISIATYGTAFVNLPSRKAGIIMAERHDEAHVQANSPSEQDKVVLHIALEQSRSVTLIAR
jgi:hypothetical protein